MCLHIHLLIHCSHHTHNQHPLASAANNLQLLDDAVSRKSAKRVNPEVPPSGIRYSEDGSILVTWKQPKKCRYRDLHEQTYEHLLDLWALKLDIDQTSYYTKLMQRYRADKSNDSTLTPGKWVDQQERIGQNGRQFMKTPQRVMVHLHILFICTLFCFLSAPHLFLFLSNPLSWCTLKLIWYDGTK